MKSLARAEHAAEILTRLAELRPDSTRRWGRMTVHQMVCHVGDAYRMVTREKDVVEISSPMQRTLVKWVALYAPMPWPRGRISTVPELDQLTGGTAPEDFAADVARARVLVERMAREAGTVAWPRHPYFGPMSVADWLRWGYLHADHHLRQFGA
jgi:DinB superfamily